MQTPPQPQTGRRIRRPPAPVSAAARAQTLASVNTVESTHWPRNHPVQALPLPATERSSQTGPHQPQNAATHVSGSLARIAKPHDKNEMGWAARCTRGGPMGRRVRVQVAVAGTRGRCGAAAAVSSPPRAVCSRSVSPPPRPLPLAAGWRRRRPAVWWPPLPGWPPWAPPAPHSPAGSWHPQSQAPAPRPCPGAAAAARQAGRQAAGPLNQQLLGTFTFRLMFSTGHITGANHVEPILGGSRA
jgi:hypothetical protein